jgi:hypothetical protein
MKISRFGALAAVGLLASVGFARPFSASAAPAPKATGAVSVSAISGHTTEAGGTATFTVSLTVAPSSTVTLPLSVSDATEGTLSTTSLSFTKVNFATPQTVTVTGVDDVLIDGDIVFTVLLGEVGYGGSDVYATAAATTDVSVTNDDNDAIIIVELPEEETPEEPEEGHGGGPSDSGCEHGTSSSEHSAHADCDEPADEDEGDDTAEDTSGGEEHASDSGCEHSDALDCPGEDEDADGDTDGGDGEDEPVATTTGRGSGYIAPHLPGFDGDTSAPTGQVLGESTEEPAAAPNPFAGQYVRTEGSDVVYYVDEAGVRHPVINAIVYFTYTDTWDAVTTITFEEFSGLTLGRPVLPKAHVVLVKIQSTNEVYALDFGVNGGTVLRLIPNEMTAEYVYGEKWMDYVIDIEPTHFKRFIMGKEIDGRAKANLTIMKTRQELARH